GTSPRPPLSPKPKTRTGTAGDADSVSGIAGGDRTPRCRLPKWQSLEARTPSPASVHPTPSPASPARPPGGRQSPANALTRVGASSSPRRDPGASWTPFSAINLYTFTLSGETRPSPPARGGREGSRVGNREPQESPSRPCAVSHVLETRISAARAAVGHRRQTS